MSCKPGARAWLARQGYDPQFGARPLRRAMQKLVEGPLSVQLLKGKFKAGDCVVIDANPENTGLVFQDGEPAMEGDAAAGEAVIKTDVPAAAAS